MTTHYTPDLPTGPIAPPPDLKRVITTVDWPTLALYAGCLGVWGGALMLPAGWNIFAFVGLVLSLALHSSLSHEILHGHPFRNRTANALLGIFQPGLLVPYLRFKQLHLDHHRDENLTDPYDDPESNFLDPAIWARKSTWMQALLGFNNTLLGRMLIGPALGMVAFVRGDLRLLRQGDLRVAQHWLLHLPGAAVTLWLVSLSAVPVWLYLAACYGAMAVLKIRTFLEHRAHAACQARTVIIEDRGILAFLFLNNNLHAVHHQHPGVSWYDLPNLYRSRRDGFHARNESYVYRSYAEVFRRYFLCCKDPVAHPLWRRR